MRLHRVAMALCVGITLYAGVARGEEETNLLGLGEGTLPVVEPPSYSPSW
jgi:hypothetical protein